jgi:hypothetical protein
MTTLASALPVTLIAVRAMSITSSTASSIATPASPGSPKLAQVPAMITSVARGTPATPFDVSMKVSTMVSCCVSGARRGRPARW